MKTPTLEDARIFYNSACLRMWAATKFAPKPWEGRQEKTKAVILNQVDLGETIQWIEIQSRVYIPYLINIEARKKANRSLSREAKKLLLQFTSLVQRCRDAKHAYQLL